MLNVLSVSHCLKRIQIIFFLQLELMTLLVVLKLRIFVGYYEHNFSADHL